MENIRSVPPFKAPEGTCAECKEREATCWFSPSPSEFESRRLHLYQAYCEICTTRAQVAYAQEMADKLPRLRARLAELIDAEKRRSKDHGFDPGVEIP